MAVWRTKACDMFGFAVNQHSYAGGKTELFADLLVMASESSDDADTLDRIAEYVAWAAEQTSEQLQSAVDLAFILPMLRDDNVRNLLEHRFSPDFVVAKRELLLDGTDSAT